MMKNEMNAKESLKRVLDLVVEYGFYTESKVKNLLKKYDEKGAKSLKQTITSLFDELGLNECMINDVELFEGDADSLTWNNAYDWANCLDTIVNDIGIDMNKLGLEMTFNEYVKGCEEQEPAFHQTYSKEFLLLIQ